VALLEGHQHLFDALLGPLQRCHRSRLGDGCGVGGALGLHLFHRLDDVGRTAGVADAPAGHGVGFGDAVHDDGAVVQVGAGVDDVDERLIYPADVLVHVVGGDDHPRMLPQHIAQGLQLFAAVGHAGWIGGAVDYHHLGLLVDGGAQLGGRDLELLLGLGLDEHRDAAGQQGHVRIGDPVGGGDDYFVPGVQQRLGHVVEALLAAAGDQDLVGLVFQFVFPAEFVDNGLLEHGGAVHCGVLGLAVADGLDGGFFDVLRGVEVGLSGAQADDVAAGGAQLGGQGGDRQGGRGFDGLYAIGEFDAHEKQLAEWLRSGFSGTRTTPKYKRIMIANLRLQQNP